MNIFLDRKLSCSDLRYPRKILAIFIKDIGAKSMWTWALKFDKSSIYEICSDCSHFNELTLDIFAKAVHSIALLRIVFSFLLLHCFFIFRALCHWNTLKNIIVYRQRKTPYFALSPTWNTTIYSVLEGLPFKLSDWKLDPKGLKGKQDLGWGIWSLSELTNIPGTKNRKMFSYCSETWRF